MRCRPIPEGVLIRIGQRRRDSGRDFFVGDRARCPVEYAVEIDTDPPVYEHATNPEVPVRMCCSDQFV